MAAMPRGEWTGGGAVGRLLVEVAAGRLPSSIPRLRDEDLALASRHGLLGILAHQPHPDLSAPARVPYTRLLARQRVMEEVAGSLLASLARSGVRATVVKGPALARLLYPDPGLRTFTDLDLLVPSAQVDAAIETIASHPVCMGLPPKTPKADKRHLPMRHSSSVGFTLDLHWDLFSYTQLRGCADGAVEEAWERASFDPDHSLGPMWLLPDETLLTFLATHAVLDHRFRLILFRDLVEAARGGVDWEALARFAERWDLRAMTYLAWLIAARLLGVDVPPAFLERVRRPSAALLAAERLLARTDLVAFDGHRPDLLNLAMVLLHDRPAQRVRLALSAPRAFPDWRRRVGRTPPARRSGPRIVHLLPRDLTRGAQTYARAMRDGLGSDLDQALVTLFQGEAQVLDADVELEVPTWPLRRLGFDPRAWWRLARALRTLHPSVVIAHGGEALKYAAFACPSRCRLVYYKIGTSADALDSRLRRVLYRLLVRRAALVAGVSQEMVAEAQERLAVASDRLAYVPNGRDPSPFAPRIHRQEAPARLVFVGHLTRTKRPERFVEVVEALRASGSEVVGSLVGDGPLLQEIRMRQGEWLSVLGRRDDVPAILGQSDLLLFTSLEEGEGMPGVLIEAGFAGLPVVTTDVPGARSVVQDGETGFVVGVDDLEGMVAACAKLAEDPSLRARMGAAAREWCLSHLTLERSLERWREELARLLSDRAR